MSFSVCPPEPVVWSTNWWESVEAMTGSLSAPDLDCEMCRNTSDGFVEACPVPLRPDYQYDITTAIRRSTGQPELRLFGEELERALFWAFHNWKHISEVTNNDIAHAGHVDLRHKGIVMMARDDRPFLADGRHRALACWLLNRPFYASVFSREEAIALERPADNLNFRDCE